MDFKKRVNLEDGIQIEGVDGTVGQVPVIGTSGELEWGELVGNHTEAFLASDWNLNGNIQGGVDSDRDTNFYDASAFAVAQPFDAAFAGFMTCFEVSIDQASPQMVTLEVYDGFGTGGTLLATASTLIVSPITGRLQFVFTSPPVLVSGNTYTLLFSASATFEVHTLKPPADYWNYPVTGQTEGYWGAMYIAAAANGNMYDLQIPETTHGLGPGFKNVTVYEGSEVVISDTVVDPGSGDVSLNVNKAFDGFAYISR